jgi:sigma factor-binding protein Crl
MNGKWPSTGKLNTRFTAIGPYFRKLQGNSELFFFDCLAECVSAKPAADEREFHGWWLTLTKVDDGFEYQYWYGYYDKKGDWSERPIPKKHQVTVEESLFEFYGKLTKELESLSLTLSPSPALEPAKALSVA